MNNSEFIAIVGILAPVPSLILHWWLFSLATAGESSGTTMQSLCLKVSCISPHILCPLCGCGETLIKLSSRSARRKWAKSRTFAWGLRLIIESALPQQEIITLSPPYDTTVQANPVQGVVTENRYSYSKLNFVSWQMTWNDYCLVKGTYSTEYLNWVCCIHYFNNIITSKGQKQDRITNSPAE